MQISVRNTGLYLMAFLAPFLAAVLAFMRPRDPVARNVIWIFVVYFGAAFYIEADSTSDSVRYAEWLALMHQGWYGFRELFGQFFAEGSRYQDVYQPLLTFLVSRLTDQHWLLFASFGVLFGYVYTRNVWFLIDRMPSRMGPLLVLLISAYAFHVDIGAGLNGVRMWTALHIFVFGFLHYRATGDRKFLLILLLTPLVHFSFWLPVGVFIGFFLVRQFGLSIYGFFLVSYVGAALELGTVQALMGYLPLPIEERAAGYIAMAESNPSVMEDRQASAIWFLRWNHWMLASFFFLTASWMVWRGCLLRKGLIRDLLVFGMLLYGAINMVSYIPSLGRFYNLAEMILLAALILFLAASPARQKVDRQVFGAAAVLLTINLTLGIRFMLGFASIWLLVGNFFLAPFVSANESLYDLIQTLLRSLR